MSNILVIKDLTWSFILPLICSFGLVANTVNYMVFSERRRLNQRNRMHQYFQFDSLAEFAYLFICLVNFILNSSYSTCIKSNYYVIFYTKYFYLYLSSVLACFIILLRMFISVRRLLIIWNIGLFHLSKRFFFKIMALVTLVSFVFNLPVVFDERIVAKSIGNLTDASWTQYELKYKRYGGSMILNLLAVLTFLMRGFLAPVVLLIVNMTIIRNLKLVFKKRFGCQKSKIWIGV